MEGRDAGSQAILSHIRALQHLGYVVSLVAAAEMETGNPAVAALADIGITCCGTPFYASVEDVLRRQADCFDVVYLHRVDIARRYLALARQHMPRARILYSVADLHHVRLERQAAIEQCPDILAASRSVKLAEFTAAWSADAVITHSAVEASLLRQAIPAAHVYRVPWDVPVRNARVKLAGRSGVTFIGSYAHSPNVDAAHWLVETVMPLIWQTDPSIECLLVGSAMPEDIRRLAGPGVLVLGHVADINTYVFDRVRLSVAPLRYGAGVKGKVLDSLAAGVPCVMTPISAEGLYLCGGLQVLVGQDATQLAALICHLHHDDVAYRKLNRAGRTLVRNDHSEAAVTAALRAAIEGHGTLVRPLQHRSSMAA